MRAELDDHRLVGFGMGGNADDFRNVAFVVADLPAGTVGRSQQLQMTKSRTSLSSIGADTVRLQ